MDGWMDRYIRTTCPSAAVEFCVCMCVKLHCFCTAMSIYHSTMAVCLFTYSCSRSNDSSVWIYQISRYIWVDFISLQIKSPAEKDICTTCVGTVYFEWNFHLERYASVRVVIFIPMTDMEKPVSPPRDLIPVLWETCLSQASYLLCLVLLDVCDKQCCRERRIILSEAPWEKHVCWGKQLCGFICGWWFIFPHEAVTQGSAVLRFNCYS